MFTKGEKIMSMFFKGEKIAGGSNGSAPMNPRNVALLPGINSILISWSDPDDTYDKDKTLLSKWAGTKIVYNEDHFPTNPTDGVMVADNIVRNAYKKSSLIVPNLVNDKKYYFKFFTYSDTGEINYNEANNYTQSPGAEIVSFADATDDQIAAMIAAHYKGYINIGDYWHVGDTRKIHLGFIDGGFPDYPYGHREDHAAQDMTFVIIGIEHDDLKTPINGHTKAAITVQCRETSAEVTDERLSSGVLNFTCLWDYTDTKTTIENMQYSKNNYRDWLNNAVLGALPSRLQGVVKTVIKKNLANFTDATPGEDTEDKVFLLSGSEVGFSNIPNFDRYAGTEELEGKRYEYFPQVETTFATTPNVPAIKYPNNNGEPFHHYLRATDAKGSPEFNEDGTPKYELDSAGNPKDWDWGDYQWILRSPSTFHGFSSSVDPTAPYWLYVDKTGKPSVQGFSITGGLAFAFCL